MTSHKPQTQASELVDSANEPALTNAEPAATGPADGTVKLVPQAEQLKNPDAIISLRRAGRTAHLGDYAGSYQGLTTGDDPMWKRCFWEPGAVGPRWRYFQGPSEGRGLFAGRQEVVASAMLEPGARVGAIRGREAWGRRGIAIDRMSSLAATHYEGDLYHSLVPAIIPRKPEYLPAVAAFCLSDDLRKVARATNPSLSIDNGYFPKMPFDFAHWQRVAAEKYPNGLPEPQSDDPTQWLFHGHPAGRVPLTVDPNPHLATVLQVAVARVVGYRWPSELDAKMRLAPEARAWVEKCKDLEKFADDDGVVPLVPINKEHPGAERVRALLEAAFGANWTPGLLNDLLAAAGSPGKSLDEWLKHEFWLQHCAVFHQRPFVWQIWDGKKDGFNVLVHYHRLAESDGKGRKLLEKITYTYLGDWITQQQAAAKRGEPGADTRLKAAQDLQKKLEAIIAGEPPYDIFVRWKPLHEQPIGWEPDINDGVRVNIRPFVTAGVLRGKVNVKWTKDRGKEPESIRPKLQFPWFYGCPEDEPPIDFTGSAKFTGERLNNLHYSNRAKQTAKEKTESESENHSTRK